MITLNISTASDPLTYIQQITWVGGGGGGEGEGATIPQSLIYMITLSISTASNPLIYIYRYTNNLGGGGGGEDEEGRRVL